MILQLGKKILCTKVKFFFQPKISLFGTEQKTVFFACNGFHVCERVRLRFPKQRPNRKAGFVIGDLKPFGIQEQKYSRQQKGSCQHNKQGTLVFCFGESFQSQKKDAHHENDLEGFTMPCAMVADSADLKCPIGRFLSKGENKARELLSKNQFPSLPLCDDYSAA